MPGLGGKLWVNAHLANDPRLWRAVKDMGFTGARIDLNGDTIMPQPDREDWDVTDRAIDGALEHGLQLYATLSYTPPWLSPERGSLPPRDWWTHFCTRVGERYHTKIRYMGAWNEYSGSPQNYVAGILAPMRAALKAVDQTLQICGPDCPMVEDWPSWLYDCLRLGEPYLDIVTVHNYSQSGRGVLKALGTARPDWIPQWFPYPAPSVRQVMEWAHAEHLPLCVTEFGWTNDRVSEEEQAKRLGEFLEALQAAPWLSAACYFQLIDDDNSRHGLLRADLTPKPAADVLRRYA